MIRESITKQRHISIHVVGEGRVITGPYGVVANWILKDITLENLCDNYQAIEFRNMIRQLHTQEERHVSINVVGLGDIITVPYGVVSNWRLENIGLEDLYEFECDIYPAIKYHNMYLRKAWYKVCMNSKDQPILLRINGDSV